MRVHIPGPLLSYTQQSRVVEASGESLDQLIDDLNSRYPGLRFRIIDEQDNIRPHIRIFINDFPAASLRTGIEESDEILILQALSGG